MARPIMTCAIAMVAGRDVADRRMRSEGRTVWNEDDYDAACDEVERLWPSPQMVEGRAQ